MFRMVLCVSIALILSAVAFAQDAAPTAKATDDSAPLQALEQETQLQIQALETQLAAAPQDAEAVQKQIADLKFQYEIQRLNILLEQAQAQGDEPRAAEIRRALDNWLNPPAPPAAPVNRPAPGTPEVRSSTR